MICCDLLLENSKLINGDIVDIGIVGDKIAFVEKVKLSVNSKRRIDVNRAHVFAGFCDSHSHTDEAGFISEFTSKIEQGFTTEVVGNCGGSAYPLSTDRARKKRIEVKICEDDKYYQKSWVTFEDYKKMAFAEKCICNQIPLVGWWTIFDDCVYSEKKECDMLASLEKCLMEGCRGLSINQSSVSWKKISREAKEKIFKILKKYDGIFAVHLADYGCYFVHCLNEISQLVNKYGVKIIYSHVKFFGSNSDKNCEFFLDVFNDNLKYTDARFDIYPFDTICTRAINLLENFEYLLANKDITTVRILKTNTILHDNEILQFLNSRKSDLQLLVEANGINKRNIQQLLVQKGCLIGTDYSSFNPRIKGYYRQTHPRAYSTIDEYWKMCDLLKIPLDEIVYKISMSAFDFFDCRDRGKIEKNHKADICVCDLSENGMTIELVVVNGKVSWDKKSIIKNGHVL